MTDRFAFEYKGGDNPATGGEAITPDDNFILTQPTRAIYVGTGGDLRVEFIDGSIETFRGTLGGMIYPMRVQKVLATGTTATDIVGLI